MRLTCNQYRSVDCPTCGVVRGEVCNTLSKRQRFRNTLVQSHKARREEAVLFARGGGALLPAVIAVPHETSARNLKIFELIKQGETYADVGRLYGITRSRVGQIFCKVMEKQRG